MVFEIGGQTSAAGIGRNDVRVTGKDFIMNHSKVSPLLAARITVAAVGLTFLSACEDGMQLSFLQPKDTAGDSAVTASNSTKLVERDIESPEVFQVTEAGLWDGRPSLGGVWVAHSEATDPERVIIRNSANGKFVIGALFRREREIPGPRIQASSDAAAALGMLAGAPVELNITALRRETVENPQSQPNEDSNEDVDTAVSSVADTAAIEQVALDPIAGAAAAIEAAAPAAPAPKPRSSALQKPLIQIGIFNVEANAKRTADQMRNAGMVPTVLAQSANNKPFWRVVVGPAQTKSERTALLKKIKGVGFSDAYAVTN